VEFERDDNDAPILNNPSQMMAWDMHPVVRQFMSIHYSGSIEGRRRCLCISYFGYTEIVSDGKKSAVDWTALSENQDSMIDPKYLPADFTFRDPSKLKKAHYQALLEHWYERQEDDNIDTVFAFKGYWDTSEDSVITIDDHHPTHQ